MKKILVPTDFSPCANYAVEAAFQFAKKFNIPVEFLHSANTTVDWNKLSKEEENKYPETKKRIGHAKSEFIKIEKKAERLKVKVNTHIAYNLNAHTIVDHGKKFGCDIIIMGTHGTSGIKETILGSTAQKIARFGKIPVMAFRNKPRNYNFKSILFSSDFKRESLKAFKFVDLVAKKFNSKINLLYVNTPGTFEQSKVSKRNMGEFKKKYNKTIDGIYIENAVTEVEGIIEASEYFPTNLVAIATHNRTGLSHLIAGSISEDLLNHSDKPVLLVPV